MGFYVIKKKTVIGILAGVISIALIIVFACLPYSKANADFPTGLTVVIDAGHGGIDAGMSGRNTKVKESDINLAVAQRLKTFLEDYGIQAVMTRSTDEGLYGTTAKNFKIRDMKEREKRIKAAKPDLVVSIHCNSFPSGQERGAQVFYDGGSEAGKAAAEAMQKMFKNNLPASTRSALPGDYFILECSPYLSVIVECGFLSNEEDEALLRTNDHQEKVAYAIFLGCLGILIV